MGDAAILNKFQLTSRYTEKSNVWEDYIILDKQYNPLNLGQGFPDFLPQQHLIDALVQTANNEDASIHQYTRNYGHPRLIQALSKLYTPLMNEYVDPYKHIAVCPGAYGALNSTIFGHIEEGDEVIVIEPSFDCYTTMIQAAGGVPKFVSLRLKQTQEVMTSSDLVLDSNELKDAFNEKTKAIILNTPHNPFGKVFSEEELMEIGNLCKKWNVLCISDEVYEWLVYKPKHHIRIATLPGMWERTITIGSAGKTFCITGWKIGWAMGPEHLIKNVQLALLLQPSSIQQEAVAIAFETEIARLDKPECHFKTLAEELESKKDHTVTFLKAAGMRPIIPEAGIFVVADWTPLEAKVNLSSESDPHKDFRFTKWFIKNVGVLGIPLSLFYSESNKQIGESFARYCFLKIACSRTLGGLYIWSLVEWRGYVGVLATFVTAGIVLVSYYGTFACCGLGQPLSFVYRKLSFLSSQGLLTSRAAFVVEYLPTVSNVPAHVMGLFASFTMNPHRSCPRRLAVLQVNPACVVRFACWCLVIVFLDRPPISLFTRFGTSVVEAISVGQVLLFPACIAPINPFLLFDHSAKMESPPKDVQDVNYRNRVVATLQLL
ncbi:hypothetical protein FQR65_LT10430 [Abscondita terminalis]|nr:hypothetical protein FQR65_LT10430 [Abscondita terminalis]